VMSPLAGWAVKGLIAALGIVLVAYGLSYRRRFAGVLEGGTRPSRQRVLRAVLWVLDGFAPTRAGFARAAYTFIVRALLRNETHRLAIAVAGGLGWMVALQDATGAALSSAYLLLLGLRIAFELPAGVPANWIFRAALDPQQNEPAGVARRVMLSFLSPLVLAPCFAVAAWQSGAVYAIGHTLYVLALSLTLIELFLAGYRKVPLTCPMPGFREHFLMLCLVQFVGFEVFTRVGDGLEQWMWSAPWRFVFVPLAMWAAWRWNRRRLAEARESGELEEGLTFENAAVTAVTRMDLSG
jgi:hypothetical protein